MTYVFCLFAYAFSNNEYCSILYHLSSYMTLNNRDLEIWVIGHWRSFKLVPFQSVTSRTKAKRNSVVFSLLWNCPSVVDDECKVCGRSLQRRGPETIELRDQIEKTHYSAPTDSLCCILGRAKRYWEEGEGIGLCFPPMTGLWPRQYML